MRETRERERQERGDRNKECPFGRLLSTSLKPTTLHTTYKLIHYFVYHIIMYNYYLLFCMYMYVLDSSSPYNSESAVSLLESGE